ncbi:MAG TPA: hypothetical protein H9850_04285 [Candidatus Anaerobiospirillum pullistercoris]|uniref:Uncharacterized protein n=1 Tax=Candidatus Anaerobiospirillum pullistercoris TaxID=2838452 RepID=A0A9D1WD20_9GAMM|nr:hypothetical protein [Candidatus Anaerobiospirillum pullistercoris]
MLTFRTVANGRAAGRATGACHRTPAVAVMAFMATVAAMAATAAMA